MVANYKSQKFLQERAILASTIEVVDQINNYVLSLIPGTIYATAKTLFLEKLH
jgi:hypothetical protein